jgi:predicted phosphodiesterase
VIQICDLVPRWDRVRQRLLAGRSMIVNAPRFFGRRSFAMSMLKGKDETRVLLLNADDFAAGGTFDYRALWNAARRKLEVSGIRYQNAGGSAACVQALAEAVLKSPERLLVFLMGGGRGREASQFDLVTVFHGVLGELPAEDKDRLVVCVLDDFSLFYYEDWRTQGVSRWDYFSERLSLGPVGADALRERLASLGGNEPWTSAAVAGVGEIHRLTGGHPGLVLEIVSGLRDLKEELPEDFWTSQALRLLRASPILESLHRALAEDSERLSAVAHAYAEPQPVTNDFARPELQILRQLGILTWVGPATAVLCGGVIRELVEERAAAPAAAIRPSPAGPSAILLDSIPPDEDDLVILHLSDIHLGDHYPFRRPGSSNLENLALRSAGELLSQDLDRLKLAGRIDALIASGDFTSRGKIGEFRRAREVIEDLMKAVGLDKEKLLVIAGNHDVDWAPEGQDHKVAETGVSRDNYATFREILDKPGDPPAEMLEIPSRSGKTILRLLALDSNYVEGEKAGGTGFIDPKAFDLGRQLLRENAALHPDRELATWIVVHHHVLPVNSAEVRNALQHKVSVMGNAADLLELAAEVRAEVILHGHEHQPLVTIARRWSSDESIPDFHPVVILGAGSFSSPYTDLGPFRRNHYFLLYRRAGDLIVRSRALGDNGLAFGKHRDLQIPR